MMILGRESLAQNCMFYFQIIQHNWSINIFHTQLMNSEPNKKKKYSNSVCWIIGRFDYESKLWNGELTK